MVTPIFVGFSQLGILEYPRFATILGITAKSMPFFVVLVRATFMSVPMELEEAALVDGNSRIGAFFHIVLPLARNGILVSAILIYMQAFGEFVYSKTFIADAIYQPASVGLNTFMGPNTVEWDKIMAYASIYVTPILAAFVLLQRKIVSGLTSGSFEMTAQIEFNAVEKYYGRYHALKNISLTIEKGSFVALVGPSGCGKSTLLRSLAGLENISHGDIRIAGERMNDAPPRKRDIAMVFQSYALYPHMTVEENLTYSHSHPWRKEEGCPGKGPRSG